VPQSKGQGTAKDILVVLDRFLKPLSDQLEKYQFWHLKFWVCESMLK
jgi:hypothetical protein